jgi:ABC-type dipeptide/oligopeptide/nickel transport system ATPase component
MRDSPPACTFAARCERADDVCRRERPELLPGPAGHPVRCFHPLPASRSATGRPAEVTE